MTAATAPARVRPPRSGVVTALARLEARRLVRHPVVALGGLVSVAFGIETFRAGPSDEPWPGAVYTAGPLVPCALVFAIALVVAWTVHRERDAVASEAPTGHDARVAGVLLGTLPLLVAVAVLVAGVALRVSASGGLDLGDEPGRTLDATYTLPELLQGPALAVLAVAMGAAAGRRFRHRATASLALFAVWFPTVFVSWLFQGPGWVPFSVVQVQPVLVEVAPVSADPLTLPTGWLLAAPGDYQAYWGRWFVSSSLAGWHDLWLLGLSALLLALVLTGPRRWAMLGAGLATCVVSIVAQYAVIP
jgi:hypothetical protein